MRIKEFFPPKWVFDGKFVTDKRFLARLPADVDPPDGVDRHPIPPKVLEMIQAEPTTGIPFDISAVRDLLEAYEDPDLCSECRGIGVVACSCACGDEHDRDCPSCGTITLLQPFPEANQRWAGDAVFDRRLLAAALAWAGATEDLAIHPRALDNIQVTSDGQVVALIAPLKGQDEGFPVRPFGWTEPDETIDHGALAETMKEKA